MIVMAGVLVAIGAVLVVVGIDLGGLAWLYGAIAAATASLLALALGVARAVRRGPHRSGPEGGRSEAGGASG